MRFLKKLEIHATIAFSDLFSGIRGHSLVLFNEKLLCFGNCSCLFRNLVDSSVSLMLWLKYASIARKKIEKRQGNCIQTSGTYKNQYKLFVVHIMLGYCL